jgi:hypothetical protein
MESLFKSNFGDEKLAEAGADVTEDVANLRSKKREGCDNNDGN